MKEFLREVLIEPFENGFDWICYFVGIFSWMVTIFFVGCLLWFFVWFADSRFLQTQKDNGIVTEHYIIPGHYTTTYMMAGKVAIPIETYIETKFMVEIKINNQTDEISLCKTDWERISAVEWIRCEYTLGRIYNTLRIQSILK